MYGPGRDVFLCGTNFLHLDPMFRLAAKAREALKIAARELAPFKCVLSNTLTTMLG
jgi:hypothetical protein